MPSKREALVMLVLTAVAVACIWLATACDAADTVENFASDHGTVYVCNSGAACVGDEEWCWDGNRRELEELLGARCHEETVSERFWPAVIGCVYRCDGQRGCNSHCGCFCETEPQ